MPDNFHYEIRRMSSVEVKNIAINWATTEGWNPGINDAEAFYQADRDGFFVGLLNDEPIACISTVAYDNHFGFLGLYIVRKEFRGKGFGKKIWDYTMEYLGNRNIGLDGVEEQQENYKKSGFKYAYGNIRYQIINKDLPNSDTTYLVNLEQIDFNDVVNYDRKYFPADRKGFLLNWLNQPNSNSVFSVSAGKLNGFGVIRKCFKGYKIGPLFADDSSIAESILLKLISYTGENEFIYLDIPEVNTYALELSKKYKMTPVFKTARMYTKSLPEIDLNNVFGVTTFELG